MQHCRNCRKSVELFRHCPVSSLRAETSHQRPDCSTWWDAGLVAATHWLLTCTSTVSRVIYLFIVWTFPGSRGEREVWHLYIISEIIIRNDPAISRVKMCLVDNLWIGAAWNEEERGWGGRWLYCHDSRDRSLWLWGTWSEWSWS